MVRLVNYRPNHSYDYLLVLQRLETGDQDDFLYWASEYVLLEYRRVQNRLSD